MFSQYGLNIFDFDIYSRRISFFYNNKDKIGTLFGLILTFLYVIITLILFTFYLTKTIKRSEVKSQESTIYSQGLPSLDINPKLFYFAFGLENPITSSRFIDEQIYYPKVYFIKQTKENGILVTKEKKSLEVERCDAKKFGKEYSHQFMEGELDNSYCIKDFNLTLFGGTKYEKSSFIEIKIHPCTNSTENNSHCKPQNIIDSHLTSGYFSITIKDIGLNPLNYSFPIIPIIQILKTNVDIRMCRESLIYIGITEIDTDVGLFVQSLKTEQYLEYRKYSQSFFFMSEEEYHNGKEIFGAQIRLEEYIHFQKREYTKMSEVFSITGGYMQLISTVLSIITIFTNNFNMEKKILNRLFNFNLKQRKIILSVQYEKNLNYLINYEKDNGAFFIPFKAKKSLHPYSYKSLQIYNNIKLNENLNIKANNNNSFTNFQKNNISEKNDSENCKIKKIKNCFQNGEGLRPVHIKKNMEISNIKEQSNNNKSKMMMLNNDEEKFNDSLINKIFGKKNLNKESQNHLTHKPFDEELLTNIDFNFFYYFCSCGKGRIKDVNIEIFNFGINFYRNQMSIINIFNIIFLSQIMITNFMYKNNKSFSQIIEIPIKA